MPEAIVTIREYDGTCTIRIGSGLIVSSLSRAAADQFVGTYRRLTIPAAESELKSSATSPSTGARQGQIARRSPPSTRGIAAITRQRE